MRIKGILYIFIVSSICSIFFSSCAKEGDLGDLMNPFGNNTTNNPGGKGKPRKISLPELQLNGAAIIS